MSKVLLLAPMSSVHEIFNAANIEALRELKCDIYIIANFQGCKHDEAYRDSLIKKGITVYDVPLSRASFVKNLNLIPVIRNILKIENFDIVHCHTETGGLISRLSIPRGCKSKFIYTAHGMSFYKGCSLKAKLLYKPIEKWICRRMDINLAMNDEEFAILKKWNSSTANMVHGIGLDLSPFQYRRDDIASIKQEFSIPDGAFVLFSTGELNNNKNHQFVINALAEIKDSNVYYVICGVGREHDFLMQLCIKLNIADKVIFAGYRYDIPRLLQVADVFVFPSLHEGLPVSIMEAMAAGLPVVCSDIRGCHDLIEDEKNGFLFPVNNQAVFIDKMQKLIIDPNLQKEMRDNNLKKIKLYSIEAVRRELFLYYSFLLGYKY